MQNYNNNDLIVNPANAISKNDSFEITNEKEKEPTEKETIVALFSLLEALTYEVMSSDVWWLASSHAKQLAVEKYGITEEVYEKTMEKFEEARKRARVQNPMHTMF